MNSQANKLRSQTLKLLDQRNYKELKKILDDELSRYKLEKKKDNFLLVEIAGSYISLSNENLDQACALIGLELFRDYRIEITGKVTESSIEYCIANGYSALYKIEIKDQKEWFITPESIKGNLFKAKQSYLKSFKLLDLQELDDFPIQVLTNLGNNLNDSGRIVEALQLFDLVLQFNPDFPEALISKADGLRFMIQTTRCSRTISLFAEIYSLYQRALKQNPIFPKNIDESIQYSLLKTIQVLEVNDFNFDDTEKEFELNRKEYDAHSEELKFYLDNFLSLSEHSLYCKCNGAKSDDLFIGHEGLNITDFKIVELEPL